MKKQINSAAALHAEQFHGGGTCECAMANNRTVTEKVGRWVKEAIWAAKTFSNFPTYFLCRAGFLSEPVDFVLRNGKIIRVHPILDPQTLDEIWRRKEYEFLPSTGTVVDIGANIGAYSFMAAERGAKVYEYEAMPFNTSLLEKTASQSFVGHIEVNQVAVGADEKELAFYYADNAYMGRADYHPDRPKSIRGHCVSFKGVLERFPVIDSLKIDVEGMEEELFRSVSTEIMNRVQFMAIEWHPEYSTMGLQGFHDPLESMGFEVKFNEFTKIFLCRRHSLSKSIV